MRPLTMDVLTTLSLLPRQYRQVLLLREVQKRSYDEISQTMGLSREGVAIQLTLARRELMRRLEMGDNGLAEPVGCGASRDPEVAG